MKKLGLLIFLVICFTSVKSQIIAYNDIYNVREDTLLDYIFPVIYNDSSTTGSKMFIVNTTSFNPNITVTIIDTTYLKITSSSNLIIPDTLSYTISDDQGNIDSARVFLNPISITTYVSASDANDDSVVNHFDIFPLGVMMNDYGEVRNNIDTGIILTNPKRSALWNISYNNINGNSSDIDGNGIIEYNEYLDVQKLLGNTYGTYIPLLSPNSLSNRFEFSVLDTFYIEDTAPASIQIPIIAKMDLFTPSYGIGFSLSVRYKDNLGNDSFYTNYQYIQKKSPWKNQATDSSLLKIEDNISRPNYKNIAYCKTDKMNDSLEEEFGTVEVVVDEVLIGIKDLEAVATLTVEIIDIGFIDNQYNILPFGSISKEIVFAHKEDTTIIDTPPPIASIVNTTENLIKVYPTIVKNKLTIENSFRKKINYSLYNILGKKVVEGTIKNQTIINTSDWSSGIYLLQIEETNSVYKILKE